MTRHCTIKFQASAEGSTTVISALRTFEIHQVNCIQGETHSCLESDTKDHPLQHTEHDNIWSAHSMPCSVVMAMFDKNVNFLLFLGPRT